MSLCLIAGGVTVRVAATAFMLVWTHSVQKTEWQEDWRIAGDTLQIVQARIKGSGAGMEPGADAVLKNGWWEWAPKVPPLPEIALRRSGAVADWRLCVDGACRTPEQLGVTGDPAVLRPCR